LDRPSPKELALDRELGAPPTLGQNAGRNGLTYGPYLNESQSNAAKLRPAPPPSRARQVSTLPTVVRALLVGACIAVGGGVYTHFVTGGGIWVPRLQTDHLSDAQIQRRQEAFAALGTLPLQPVPTADLSTAIDGMRLPPAERDALLAAAMPIPTPTPTPSQTPAAAPQKDPLRLAWITLWDTDVQDGDVVRIDSEGYSRTITLTKRGETFAVPVPANGIVTVTGIKDGDGGGITVGLASGAAQAVFPIMSTGQVLGLRVALD
jgi:hypothetical protein